MAKYLPATQESQSVSTYVPFGGRRDIGNEAARPRPEHVTLSWANGLKAQRPSVKDGKLVIDEISGEVIMENILYAGFFCDCGEDEDLDAALEAADTPKVTIVHPESGPVEHWALQRCAIFLLAEGLQSKSAMEATTDRMGVAYGGRTNKAGRYESFLYCQVMPRQLLGRYNKPLVLAIKGTQTEDVLKLFYRQFEVLRFAHEYLRSINADMELPLWSFAHPAAPASKTVPRGTTKVSDIFPVISLVKEQVTVDHLQKFEAPVEHLELLAELSAQSVRWSSDLVARIVTESDPFAGYESGAGGGR